MVLMYLCSCFWNRRAPKIRVGLNEKGTPSRAVPFSLGLSPPRPPNRFSDGNPFNPVFLIVRSLDAVTSSCVSYVHIFDALFYNSNRFRFSH